MENEEMMNTATEMVETAAEPVVEIYNMPPAGIGKKEAGLAIGLMVLGALAATAIHKGYEAYQKTDFAKKRKAKKEAKKHPEIPEETETEE